MKKINNSDPVDSIVAQKLSVYKQLQTKFFEKSQHYQTIIESQDGKQRKNKIKIKGQNLLAKNLLADVNSLNHYFKQDGAATNLKIIFHSSSNTIVQVTIISWKTKQLIH